MDITQYLNEIVENPDGYREIWRVLADWLEDAGDPRGKLIQLTAILTRSHTIANRTQMEAEMCDLISRSGIEPLLPQRVNSIGIEFVFIPAGQFQMGSPLDEDDRDSDEGPVDVELTEPFWIGRYPITQRQWLTLMPHNQSAIQLVNASVHDVNWNHVREFCRRLSDAEFPDGEMEYRLPTEAQWEYACRAGTTTPMAFEDLAQIPDDLRRRQSDRYFLRGPISASKFLCNAFGLYGFHGNVWEWCEDAYEKELTGGVDPCERSMSSVRVIRGGSFRSTPNACRSAYREKTADTTFTEAGARARAEIVPAGARIVLVGSQ